MSTKNIVLNIRLDASLAEGLQEAARVRNRTVSNMVQTVVLKFLTEESRKPKREPDEILDEADVYVADIAA
jgi:predicted transcriptional regulator